jgi:hypothetical protein
MSALARQTSPSSSTAELERTMEHVSGALPGLGEPTPVVVTPTEHGRGAYVGRGESSGAHRRDGAVHLSYGRRGTANTGTVRA